MPAEKLKEFLDARGVRYTSLQHSRAFTAQGVAAALHVHGWEVAKAVVLKADGTFVMAVVPGPSHVDIEKFRRLSGARSVALATESELLALFPGCEVGGMPPFGNLWSIPVWVDEGLAADPSIVFNAGSHREAMRMEYADFERLSGARRAAFARA
jgi:Ala-tRNA(Pro) deacylase